MSSKNHYWVDLDDAFIDSHSLFNLGRIVGSSYILHGRLAKLSRMGYDLGAYMVTRDLGLVNAALNDVPLTLVVKAARKSRKVSDSYRETIESAMMERNQDDSVVHLLTRNDNGYVNLIALYNELFEEGLYGLKDGLKNEFSLEHMLSNELFVPESVFLKTKKDGTFITEDNKLEQLKRYVHSKPGLAEEVGEIVYIKPPGEPLPDVDGVTTVRMNHSYPFRQKVRWWAGF